jgi:hypothetical protein
MTFCLKACSTQAFFTRHQKTQQASLLVRAQHAAFSIAALSHPRPDDHFPEE